MKKKTDQIIIEIVQKHYKIFTGLLTIFLLLIFYIFMRSRTSDPTAYSHLMYLAIVFAGSILGSHFGMLTGLIAGILVGPLLPLDIELNTPQSFGYVISYCRLFYRAQGLYDLDLLVADAVRHQRIWRLHCHQAQ